MYVLVHATARQRAIEGVRDAPDGYVVTIKPPTRNSSQNAALHALIAEIAETCEHAGRRWDCETWKRLLVAAWCRVHNQHVHIVPALDGFGVDMVPRRTSTLTKAECSDLLEFVQAWYAEHGQ